MLEGFITRRKVGQSSSRLLSFEQCNGESFSVSNRASLKILAFAASGSPKLSIKLAYPERMSLSLCHPLPAPFDSSHFPSLREVTTWRFREQIARPKKSPAVQARRYWSRAHPLPTGLPVEMECVPGQITFKDTMF